MPVRDFTSKSPKERKNAHFTIEDKSPEKKLKTAYEYFRKYHYSPKKELAVEKRSVSVLTESLDTEGLVRAKIKEFETRDDQNKENF